MNAIRGINEKRQEQEQAKKEANDYHTLFRIRINE